jgi:uncharacterized membrane protein YfcA
MFGIGGALVATPLLKVFLGLPALLALATPLPAAIPSAISGSIAYARTKLVRYEIAWRVLLVAMPTNLLGAYLTKFTSDIFLMVATGVVLAYSAWTFIRRGFAKTGDVPANPNEEQPFGPLAYAACALAGFTSGFLAIGGGIVMVPAFVKVLRIPTKQAVATSLLCVAALAVPGVLVHTLLEHIDWPVALTLCISVVPMSYLGARLTTRMKNSTLERAYGIVMLGFAIYFVIKNINP